MGCGLGRSVAALNQAFGARVRAMRESSGWTLGRLGKEADLNKTYVGQIERGLRDVSLSTILRLAKALRVNADSLVRGLAPAETAESGAARKSSPGSERGDAADNE